MTIRAIKTGRGTYKFFCPLCGYSLAKNTDQICWNCRTWVEEK